MGDEVRGIGLDGRLTQLVVAKLVERVDPLAAFLYVPVEDQQVVQDLQFDILNRLAPPVEIEPVEPENLHITLLYIDKVKPDDLEEFFNEVALHMPLSFVSEVSHVGTFPEAEEKPIVAHLASTPSLVRLQNELYNAAFSMGLPLSVFSKPENFKPHISLAMNLQPPHTPIPDLKEPIHVVIDRFVASRPDYERLRTIHLPTATIEEIVPAEPEEVMDEEVLEERTDGPNPEGAEPASEPRRIGGSIPKGATTQAEDRRKIMDAIARPGGSQEPLKIRILYDPNLGKKEGQSVNTFDTFDITLGPAFYRGTDDEEREGILARLIGMDLGRRMLLAGGGAHEWQRAEAMMRAPPEDEQAGFRYVFANNALLEAVADTYAVLSVNPSEIGERNYWTASDWIGMAVTEHPVFAPDQLPNLMELNEAIGDEPVFPGVTLVVEDASILHEPTLEELQEDDEEDGAGMVTGSAINDEEFAISKSDFMYLIGGGALIYGPLRRTLTLEDGPFIVVDDGIPVERIRPPKPADIEPKPEPEIVVNIVEPEPELRERITTILRSFVEGALRLVGRHEGPGEHETGSEQEAHAGDGAAAVDEPEAEQTPQGDTTEGTAISTPPDDRIPEAVTPEEHEDPLFHGTSEQAARSILEKGLLVSFADENNWKPNVVYASDDREMALEFAAQSEYSQYAIITLDPDKIGSEGEQGRIGRTFNHDIPPEAISKIEIYRRGYQRKDDELVETINRAEAGGELYAAAGILDDGTYRVIGEGPDDRQPPEPEEEELLEEEDDEDDEQDEDEDEDEVVKRGGPGSGHHGHEGRPGEVGGSAPADEGPAERESTFEPDMIDRAEPMPGTCFECSARWLIMEQGRDIADIANEVVMVHGIVGGQGFMEGKRFTHAWIEIDDKWVYDRAQDLVMPKNEYYEVGKVERIKDYDPTEVRIELLKNEHWGPWLDELLDFEDGEEADE